MPSEVVDSSRFKSLAVKSKCSIRDFVSKNKLVFRPGKGFYQLTKPETIQIYKEIVARSKTDGTFVTGSALRKILGIPLWDTAGKFRLDLGKIPDFDVFVQSTSYNRVLVAGTDFLYEADDAAPGISGFGGVAAAREAAIERFADETDALETVPDSHPADRDFVPPAPPGGAGSPLEIVFSFDTTGSMYGYIDEVRRQVESIIMRLLGDIPAIRIAVFAHGDYCDRHTYVTKWIDFSSNKAELCKFVRKVGPTGGGDYPECYELALHQIRTKLSWTGGTLRSLVMIGDAEPHKPSEKQNTLSLDWRYETLQLKRQMGVRIYSVECGAGNIRFWRDLATMTGGHHLRLQNIATVVDFLLAICYREHGAEHLERFESEVRARELKRAPGSGMNKELHKLFEALKRADDDVTGAGPTGSGPSGGKKRKRDDDDDAAGAGGLAALVAKKLKSAPKKKTAPPPPPPAKRGRKAAPKPATAKRGVGKKAPPKKAAAKKAPAKRAPARKAPAKKAPTKKAPAKKGPPKKAPCKKAPVKKAPAKKAPAKKAPAKKVAGKTVVAKKHARKAPSKRGTKTK